MRRTTTRGTDRAGAAPPAPARLTIALDGDWQHAAVSALGIAIAVSLELMEPPIGLALLGLRLARAMQEAPQDPSRPGGSGLVRTLLAWAI